MNGNNAPNIVDVREIVFECGQTFLTDVSAREIAGLVAERIDGMDVLELKEDGASWELVNVRPMQRTTNEPARKCSRSMGSMQRK